MPNLPVDPTTRRTIHGWSLRRDEARAVQARAGGWWRDETIAADAARLAAAEPDRILIIDGEHRLDARTLHARADRLARLFVSRGLAPGSVVSFMLPNWHEAAVIYLAAAMAGLVVHPLVIAYREAELAYLLADSGSRMVFVPERFRNAEMLATMTRAVAAIGNGPEIVTVRARVPGVAALDDLLGEDHRVALPVVDPDSVLMIIYTSGTTGRPKGVLHSHNSLHATVRQLHLFWEAGRGDAFLVPSPIGHIGGSIYAFEFPLLHGTVAILQDRWDAGDAVTLIDRHRCTHMAGATPFLQGLLASAKASGNRLPSLQLFVCGGASVPPSLIREAAAWLDGCKVTRVFGLTEVPTITIGIRDRADIDHAADTDGMIGISEVKLLGADGDHGEVAARGPQMLRGYLRPEDEADAFDAQGFFRTGDIADRVDGQYLRISGRAKDIIIRHGENISPKEVEDLLVQHPDVADIAIVGLPSPRTGELACAVVVPRTGAAPELASLCAFLEERRLARFKLPERLVLRDTLPRNAIGKVLKTALRDALLAEG